jgi:hypothetical protein
MATLPESFDRHETYSRRRNRSVTGVTEAKNMRCRFNRDEKTRREADIRTVVQELTFLSGLKD